MVYETRKEKGRAGMSLGIAYFGANGYTVSIPLNDTQWYDLVVEEADRLYSVQCKTTGTARNAVKMVSECNNQIYGHIFDHPLDFLFCVGNDGTLYNIPVSALRKYFKRRKPKTLTLYKSKPKNTFDTSKYIVKI